jgi:hypothetical protein
MSKSNIDLWQEYRKSGRWLTRDGRVVLISEMDEGHLRNCIERIKRSKVPWRTEYLPLLELELFIRVLGLREPVG